MKKQNRNAEKFDVLELFSTMGAEHGYDLKDPIAQNDFINCVRSSIESSKNNNIAIFGKRTETIFAYVVGALGKTALLKQEDSGDIYFSGGDVLAPDYRLTLDDKQQILVEVKNFHFKRPENKYLIKKYYYKKLKRYADVNCLELKFAIYFHGFNLWTLLSIDSFEEKNNSYTIGIDRAMACSEMAMLGDRMIATTPDLELHLLADPKEASKIDDSGSAPFITRVVKIYCAGNEIIDEQEKKIAFHLIQYGTWIEKEVKAIIDNNKLHGMKFIYTPEEKQEQGFTMIGNLSTMVTNGFKIHTVKNGDVVALKLSQDPAVFKVMIPQDYKGKQLPLWRFELKADPEFKSGINT